MQNAVGRLGASGLAVACLLAFSPAEAARGDARGSVRAAVVPKPAAVARPQASRPSAAPSRQAVVRPSASPRPSAARHQLAARGSKAAGRQAESRDRLAMPAPYARQQVAPNALRQTAMASCVVRSGRRVCGPVMRTVSFRWTQGGNMPPATMAQSTCPDGTMATTALGHTDVVRCVPL